MNNDNKVIYSYDDFNNKKDSFADMNEIALLKDNKPKSVIRGIPIRLDSCPPPSHPHAQIQGEKWAKGRKLGRIGIINIL